MSILILFLFFQNTLPYVSANKETTYYAKVLYDLVYLYKTPVENNASTNVYFEIPKTYFVELTNNINSAFYEARYLNFTGYVKKESVQAVASTPVNPFLTNINFRVYADLSRNLQSEPNVSSSSSTLLATIPLYSRNITYIGSIDGETLIEGRTGKWIFCKYSADVDYYGYVYSDFCDELPTSIPENTEEVSFISNPTFEEVVEKPNTNSIPVSSKTTGVVVGILCVPALIFVLLIINNKFVVKKERIPGKEVIDY